MSTKIILGLTSSVAVYKSAYLLRSLLSNGCRVKVVFTPAATKLISPQLFSALGADGVFVDLFPETIINDEYHIPLARWGDSLVIAPCTANTLCKLAWGIADNLLTTLFLAMSDKPRWIVPAMHSQMWESPQVQSAVRQLSSWGVNFVGPTTGALASGDSGEGRMVEPEEIIREVLKRGG